MSKNQPGLEWAGGRFGFGSFVLCPDSKRSLLLHSVLLSVLDPPASILPLFPMVGVAGFEPATLRLSSACSNQLSYTPLYSPALARPVSWRHGDSNPRPIACKATALPTE